MSVPKYQTMNSSEFVSRAWNIFKPVQQINQVNAGPEFRLPGLEIQSKFSTELPDHSIGQSGTELSVLAESGNPPLLETSLENTLPAPLNSMIYQHCCQQFTHEPKIRNVSVSLVIPGDQQIRKILEQTAATRTEVKSQLQIIPRSIIRDLHCVSLPHRPTAMRKKCSLKKSKLNSTKGSKLRQKGLYWTVQFHRASKFKFRTAKIPPEIVRMKQSLAATKPASIIERIVDLCEVSASKNTLFLEEERTLNQSYMEILTFLARSTSMTL